MSLNERTCLVEVQSIADNSNDGVELAEWMCKKKIRPWLVLIKHNTQFRLSP
jgi:hypothetical protein